MDKIAKKLLQNKSNSMFMLKHHQVFSFSSISEIPISIERKHVTKKCFKTINKPFLNHPKSCTVSKQPLIKDRKIVSLFEKLETEMKVAAVNSLTSGQFYKSKKDENSQDHILFLSKEELVNANKQLTERAASLLDNSRALSTDREPIDTGSYRDDGLKWLYDSDILFADCSDNASSQSRYIVTRKVDGTLYHNSHSERDIVNSSFFREENQVYPPLDLFEDDFLFQKCLTSPETDFLSLLGYLERCYSNDNPYFNSRHSQIMKYVFDDPAATESVLYSKYFLPLLARAVHENVTIKIAKLSNMLMKTERYNLAVVIEDILMRESDLVQKPGQRREHNKILLVNSLNTIAFPDIHEEKRKFLTVSKICDIDESSIKTVRHTRGGDLVATLDSEEMAKQLHDDGSGRVILFDKNIFHVFAMTENY